MKYLAFLIIEFATTLILETFEIILIMECDKITMRLLRLWSYTLQAKAKKNLLVILNRKDLKLNCKHSSKDFLCILRHEKKINIDSANNQCFCRHEKFKFYREDDWANLVHLRLPKQLLLLS